jgi:hypothetical protein
MAGRSSAVLFKRAQTLATRDNDGTIELAEVLSDLRALPKPPDGDRPTLNELVVLTKLSKRAVCYLLKVWRRFSDLDIPRDRLAQIGWTKLAAIAENCDPGDEQNALTLAEACTLKELPARLERQGCQAESVHGPAPIDSKAARALRVFSAGAWRSSTKERPGSLGQGESHDEGARATVGRLRRTTRVKPRRAEILPDKCRHLHRSISRRKRCTFAREGMPKELSAHPVPKTSCPRRFMRL